MGKTRNRTERIKNEMKEKDGLIEELQRQLRQLENENQALRLSLQQQAGVSGSGDNPFVGVIPGVAPPSTSSSSSSLATTTAARDALPFGGFTTLSQSLNRSIFASTDLSSFSNTATVFGSSNPFSGTQSCAFGSSTPFAGSGGLYASGAVHPDTLSSAFGSSNPSAGSGGLFTFGAVRTNTHFGPSLTLESEAIVPVPVRREPRRFRRVKREPIIDTSSSSSFTSGDDYETDEEETHTGRVEIEDASMSALMVPEVNATSNEDEEIVASAINGKITEPVDGEIVEPELVDDIGSCHGEVEAIKKEEWGKSVNGAENALVNDFVEDKVRALEIGKAWLVQKEEMSNDELKRILQLSEALNQKVDEEPEKMKNNCNTKLVQNEEAEELIERMRENEEQVNAMLVEEETKLDEMKRFVAELHQEIAFLNNHAHQLKHEAKEQEKTSAAMKEEMERNLETTRSQYNAILREREEMEKQLVEMHNVMNELQLQNLSQKDEIHRLQKRANNQRRRKLWPKVSSFFVCAATCVAFVLCRR